MYGRQQDGIDGLTTRDDLRRFVEQFVPPNLDVLLRQLQGRVHGPQPPQARVYRSAALSHVNSGNLQHVAVVDESYDEGTDEPQADPANSQLVCRVAGLYSIVGAVRFAANATGRRIAELRTDAGATALAAGEGSATATAIVTCAASDFARFDVGDDLRLYAFQASGGNLAFSVGEVSIYLAWAWLGP
jgi:hypothetical protein